MSKNPQQSPEPDMQEVDAARTQGIRDWVAAHLGGNVLNMTRLERWRPQWKVEYRTGDGSVHAVLVRGERPLREREHANRW